MPKRHDDLFDSFANFAALRLAAKRALKGKRKKTGAALFQFNLEKELLRLVRELHAGTYRTGRYTEILLTKPKQRLVSAAPFRDRVVQHALLDSVAPIFEKGFIAHSFANRKGKGTHKAIATYEHYRNRHEYVLRCDIFRFFPAIDHAILKAEFRRRLRCKQTLDLMDVIVDGSNPQEAVDLVFPGDDLLTPLSRHRGLPIGNLMSQFSANLYLNPLDHYITEIIRAPYLRYVDDFALFSDNLEQLSDWQQKITKFLIGRRLKLHPRKTRIQSCDQATEFLGLVLHKSGRRSMPGASIDRFKGQLRCLKDRVRMGAMAAEEAQLVIDGWLSHSQHGHARGLNRAMLGKERSALHTQP